MLDEKKFLWNENEWEMINIRITYFTILFISLLPFMFKKNILELKRVTIYFIITMFILLIYMLIESPFYRFKYVNNDDYWINPFFNNLNLGQIPIFYSIMMSFYI